MIHKTGAIMGRYMRRNKGTEGPSNLIFFDTESYITETDGPDKIKTLTLRLWTAIRIRLEKGQVTRRKVADGDTQESFWQFVFTHTDTQRTTWVFAHNLIHDLTQIGFWNLLDNQTFTIKPIYSKLKKTDGSFQCSWQGKLSLDQRPTFMQVRSDNKKFKFVDTCNYWPKKLYEIGKDYGLDKGILPTQSDERGVWLRYCLRDSEIIEKAVTELILTWTKEKCGVFQMTAPSLAMTNYRHTTDMLTPDGASVDIVPTGGSKATVLERETYFGGRFQCFFVGEVCHRVYQIDCNSLYPYVMRENLFPRRFMFYEENPDVKRIELARHAYGIAARVFIDSRFATYPCRIDKKQYHCTGRYWSSLCASELDRALSDGSVSRISTAQFYSLAPLFRTWVDYWYDRKVRASRLFDNRPGEYEFCKLILNSLSGKFAQTGRHWKDRPSRIPLCRWGPYYHSTDSENLYTRFRGVGGCCQELIQSEEPEHAFPLISAYITSYAREYMRHVISVCGERNVYYMATDSLIVNDSGLQNLDKEGYLHPFRLGKFKIEYDAIHCKINGSNNYSMGTRKILSGPIAKAKLGPDGILRAELWEQTPSIIAQGPKNDILIREVRLMPPDPDHKGIIGDDGWWTPYRITDDIDYTDRPKHYGYLSADCWGRVAAHTQPI